MQTPLTPAVLRPRDAAAYLGIGRSTLWRWAQCKPKFPKPCKLADRVTVWKKSELDAFLEQRASAIEGGHHA